MDIYYINLVWCFNFYHELKAPSNIDSLRALVSDRNNKIILSVINEVWSHDKILFALEMLGVEPKQDNVILIIDSYSYNNHDNWETVNTIVYDSLLCMTYGLDNTFTGPNLDHDKFLFIVGKPHKKQRIYALYELYQRNMLDKCNWSLFYSSDLEEPVRSHLPAMSDDLYLNFIEHTNKSLDQINPVIGDQSIDFHRICFKPTSEIFSNSAISLVTETTFSRDLFWFITEKTWKAVNSFHPFVLLDYKETYEYLESLGIDTFQYAVKHPYEKLVGTEEEVIKMCVDNVLHMLDHKNYYKEELTKSAIHNHIVFENLANSYSAKLHPYIEKLLWAPYTGGILQQVARFHKISDMIAVEVYEKLWDNNGAVGED